MHIKTVILLRNFSFGLINFVNLSTTFFYSTFFNIFYFFNKKHVFNVFYSWVQRFFYIWFEPSDVAERPVSASVIVQQSITTDADLTLSTIIEPLSLANDDISSFEVGDDNGRP